MDIRMIRRAIYIEQKEKLVNYIDKKWEEFDLKNFHFLSANLLRCLPQLPLEQHKQFYYNILSYRILQSIDLNFHEGFSKISGADRVNEEIKKVELPAIFVSFHLGSFRSSMAFLIQNNINVVLIIDPIPFQTQKEDIEKQFQEIKNFFKSRSELIIFAADRKDLSVQILSKTKSGYSVLAFIDGNNGVNGAFNQTNSVKIDFFGQKVYFRKGLATLSYYTKCPIVPILSFYDENDDPHWEITETIDPVHETNPHDYEVRATHELYNLLEEALKKYPDQWEGWLYLHKFIEINSEETNQQINDQTLMNHLIINSNIGLFSYESQYYVLNKINYKIIEIPRELFYKLNQNSYFESSGESVEDIEFLISKGILQIRSE